MKLSKNSSKGHPYSQYDNESNEKLSNDSDNAPVNKTMFDAPAHIIPTPTNNEAGRPKMQSKMAMQLKLMNEKLKQKRDKISNKINWDINEY